MVLCVVVVMNTNGEKWFPGHFILGDLLLRTYRRQGMLHVLHIQARWIQNNDMKTVARAYQPTF